MQASAASGSFAKLPSAETDAEDAPLHIPAAKSVPDIFQTASHTLSLPTRRYKEQT
ncbi:hypothetical protein [Kingella potus]|uniref:hypothetical protein n=1 Tax=Kingella potus TaxID=265175 RepID=UPI001FD20182|nr:hypothetical protein [Kingella potus]UOP00930.1 hypothetical protein LVJ84_00480 [Kingella potus]